MCLAFPGKVIELNSQENKGIINIKGVKKEINTRLLEDISIGDYVLIHAGFAISKTTEEEAEETLELFEELAEASEV